MNISYECNQCGIVLTCSGCPQCSKCGKLMTPRPSVHEIMRQIRYRRMITNSPHPAAEAMAWHIDRKKESAE